MIGYNRGLDSLWTLAPFETSNCKRFKSGALLDPQSNDFISGAACAISSFNPYTGNKYDLQGRDAQDPAASRPSSRLVNLIWDCAVSAQRLSDFFHLL
jgi:hypothetical protein